MAIFEGWNLQSYSRKVKGTLPIIYSERISPGEPYNTTLLLWMSLGLDLEGILCPRLSSVKSKSMPT